MVGLLKDALKDLVRDSDDLADVFGIGKDPGIFVPFPEEALNDGVRMVLLYHVAAGQKFDATKVAGSFLDELENVGFSDLFMNFLIVRFSRIVAEWLDKNLDASIEWSSLPIRFTVEENPDGPPDWDDFSEEGYDEGTRVSILAEVF
jgi:hypothetical protein